MTTTTLIALLLAVVSTCVHQVEGVMIKKYNEKYESGGYIFIALVSLVAMVFFFITDTGGLNFTLEMIPYGILSGAFYCMASILTFVAYGCGSFVLSNLFLSYALLFSVFYGLFVLSEPATVFTYAGLLLMLVSVFLVRAEKKEPGAEKVKISLKWIISITLSVIGSGMYGVMQKLQQVKFAGTCDNEFMIVTLGFTTVTMLVFGIIKDRKQIGYIFRHGAPYACIAGVANGATNLMSLMIYAMIPISIAAPTRAGIKILVSFLLALFIFKEKLGKRQIAGVILGTAALIVLNLDI